MALLNHYLEHRTRLELALKGFADLGITFLPPMHDWGVQPGSNWHIQDSQSWALPLCYAHH